MDANAALNGLLGLSTQVVEAVIVDGGGAIEASSAGGEARAEELAEAGRVLLAAASDVRRGDCAVTRVEVGLPRGSVFVVRESGRTIVATTIAEPTPGLVVYDLRTALRQLEDAAPAGGKRKKKAG